MPSAPAEPRVKASRILNTPIGAILASASDVGITGLAFVNGIAAREPGSDVADRRVSRHLDRLEQELASYFACALREFTVALDLQGTAFQLRVWNELLGVGWGRTMSYAQLALRIDRPDACRAVARANGANPVPIVVPCHRVIGSDGSLTGYGGGMERKRKLLEIEGRAGLLPL